jgi:ComF family protein
MLGVASAALRARDFALELLAPSRCAASEVPHARSTLFCRACEPPNAAPLRTSLACGLSVIALGPYEGSLATAVRRMKYEERPDLARLLGTRLGETLREAGAPLPDVVVPIPLHPKRLAERGYNQAALVARELARALGAGLSPRRLVRIRETGQQASLDKAERRANVAGAFAARAPLDAASVLLVDDVVTTGATVVEAAATLLLAGAREVSVAAVLRADHDLLR